VGAFSVHSGAELKIVFTEGATWNPRVFVDDEQIGLIQNLRLHAVADLNSHHFHLEVEWPPDDVTSGLNEASREAYARYRSMLAPFIYVPPPPPPSPTGPTVWERLNADEDPV
jgi:hypothetical protein